MKKNRFFEIIIYIILFCIITIPFLLSIHKVHNEYLKNQIIAENAYKKDCINENNSRCYDLKQYYTHPQSYWELLNSTTTFYSQNFYALIVILVLPITLIICRYFKNNNFTLEMQRKQYPKIINKIILKSYIPSIIFVTSIAICLIVAYFTTGNTDYNSYLANFKEKIYNSTLLYSLIYILKNFLISLIYANITLISIRKNKKFIQTTLITILSIILIEIALEVIIGVLLCNIIFNYDDGLIFNIINGLSYNFDINLTIQICFLLSAFIISFVILKHVYKNKEKIVIDYEGV